MAQLARARTSVLELAYENSGPVDALPVVLLHGYPYDVRAFDEVVPVVNGAGYRTIVPYLRGYGPTRFLAPDIPRSGEQAALGQDLLDLLDALQLRHAVLAGFDWGGRARRCGGLARACSRACELHRLSNPGYRDSEKAGRSRARAPLLVSALFSERTGARRTS